MSIHEVQIAGDWASIESVKPYAKANIAKKRELLQRKVVRLTRPLPGPFKTEMTLYDEYRREFPIAAEPSEFRGIIEAEVRRALEWMMGRDKPLPAEDIKPGRYRMTQTTEMMVDVVQGIHGLFVMSDYFNLPIEQFYRSNVTFQAVEGG